MVVNRKAHDQNISNKPIIFFDGVCGLCNHTVNFFLKVDKKQLLFYAPLQGELAQSLLSKAGVPLSIQSSEIGIGNNLSSDPPDQLQSVVFKQGENIYYKSEAIIQILIFLGGVWGLARVFLLVPQKLRDFVYDLIAKHRYQWFGKLESCRLPSSQEKDRFI